MGPNVYGNLLVGRLGLLGGMATLSSDGDDDEWYNDVIGPRSEGSLKAQGRDGSPSTGLLIILQGD